MMRESPQVPSHQHVGRLGVLRQTRGIRRHRQASASILITTSLLFLISVMLQVNAYIPRLSTHRQLYTRVYSSTTTSQRTRNYEFVSPLLEYGYRPAVEDWEATYCTNTTIYPDKPLLLYLPGFDGSYLSTFLQFPELHTVFDTVCLKIEANDRSTFDELVETVLEYVHGYYTRQEGLAQQPNQDAVSRSKATSATRDKNTKAVSDKNANLLYNSTINNADNNTEARKGGFWGLFSWGRSLQASKTSKTKSKKALKKSTEKARPVYLMGESFGGILAIEVALQWKNYTAIFNQQDDDVIPVQLQGLCLVNPATCYDRSILAAKGPIVARSNPLVYPLAVFQLLPLFADDFSLAQLLLILRGQGLPSIIDNPIREAYMGRVAFSLPYSLPSMPQATLQWRLSKWLETGCARLLKADRLESLRKEYPRLRTLIVAGQDDRTLPSIDEAERLCGILPNPLVHVVEGAGHASTCGSRVDLTALMRKWFADELKIEGRTSIKETARGKCVYLGIEPRYDNKTIGLSPLKYWSAEYYKAWQPAKMKRRGGGGGRMNGSSK
jgi:pimeloyl-ACP methyl ester carboxylesterase